MNKGIIEYPSCHTMNNSNSPQVEMVRIPKGATGCLELHHNEVAFFMEGRLKFIFGDFHEHESIHPIPACRRTLLLSGTRECYCYGVQVTWSFEVM